MRKRILCALIALCVMVMCLPVLSAAGAEGYMVYVVTNTLPVYESANEASRVLGVASYGEGFMCDAVHGAWCRVFNGSQYGFCRVAGVETNDPNTMCKPVYIRADDVSVYRKPDGGSNVMMRVSKNACYVARAVTRDGAWYRLQNGKYYGYVESRFISDQRVRDDAYLIYITDNTLNAYAAPDTSSQVLGVMTYGESFLCTGVNGAWARIENGSRVGYCLTSGASPVDPNTMYRRIYINANNVPVHRKATRDSDVMMYLPWNSSYIVRAITRDGMWYRLQNGSYFGFVEERFVSSSPLNAGK